MSKPDIPSFPEFADRIVMAPLDVAALARGYRCPARFTVLRPADLHQSATARAATHRQRDTRDVRRRTRELQRARAPAFAEPDGK